MNIIEAKKRLQEIRLVANNQGRRFPLTEKTLPKVEDWARDVKVLVANFGYFPDVYREMDNAIKIAETQNKVDGKLDDYSINQAISALIFGIELFLEKDVENDPSRTDD